MQVRADGDVCRRCGGRGCLAAVVGSSLLDFAQRSYEERLALPQVLALVAEREPGVRRVFADLGRLVGEPLAGFCTMLDPAAVVIDGALGAAGQYVLAGIRESIDRHTAPVVADSIQVISGELGDRAELLGGAALARQSVSTPSAPVPGLHPVDREWHRPAVQINPRCRRPWLAAAGRGRTPRRRARASRRCGR